MGMWERNQMSEKWRKSGSASIHWNKHAFIENLCNYDSDERLDAESKLFWIPGMTLSLIIQPVQSAKNSRFDEPDLYRRIGMTAQSLNRQLTEFEWYWEGIRLAESEDHLIDLV